MEQLDELTVTMVNELLKMSTEKIYQLREEWLALLEPEKPDKNTLLYINALVNYVLSLRSATAGKKVKDVAIQGI